MPRSLTEEDGKFQGSVFPLAPRSCHTCGEEPAAGAAGLSRCAQCRCASYCSTACQRADWPRHKPECLQLKAARCPLGDLTAQTVAILAASERPPSYLLAAAEAGDVAAQCALGQKYEFGAGDLKEDKRLAARWYKRAAASNVALAQGSLGVFCGHGLGGVPVDRAETIRLYTLAAAQGHANTQHNLAVCYRDALGVPVNVAEYVRLSRLAAEQGHASAQSNLASAFLFGKNDVIAVDFPKALKWARLAAAQGFPAGEYQLGLILAGLNGGGVVPKDQRAAVALFETSLANGHADSETCLHVLADEGVAEAAEALRRLGIRTGPIPPGEHAAAIRAGICPLGVDAQAEQRQLERWAGSSPAKLRAAAESGDVGAQFAWGETLQCGHPGTRADPRSAVLWYRRAADAHLAIARTRLGAMYGRGQGGLPQNPSEARRLYELAAAAGQDDAQYNLACQWRIGEGGPRDDAKAAHFYRLAAEQGHSASQAELANCLMEGNGVRADHAEAMQWARRSSSQGSAVGTYNLGALVARGGAGCAQDLGEAVRLFEKAAAILRSDGNDMGAAGAPLVALRMFADQGVPGAAAALQRALGASQAGAAARRAAAP